MSGPLKLGAGAHLVVIGGGPAGCFFSLFAMRLAREKGTPISVTIVNGKDFLAFGPSGCNMCAGVLAETLVEDLEAMGLPVPQQRVQRRIDGYYFHTREEVVFVPHPQGRSKIVTVFRGAGPGPSEMLESKSFDHWLLQAAERDGARVLRRLVTGLDLPGKPGDRARVATGKGGEREEIEADLVIGAFGLNSKAADWSAGLGFGYKPPGRIRACQAEVPLPAAEVERLFGNFVHTYVLGIEGVRFAAIIPKAEHLTISLVGTRDLKREDLARFLQHPVMQAKLPRSFSLPATACVCLPNIASGSARHPFADRFVIVGDAAASRHYKNGLESAYLTAKLAAETAIGSGVASEDFAGGYWRQCRRLIVADNRYGRLLLGGSDFMFRRPLFARSYFDLAQRQRSASGKATRIILWNLLTGTVPYKDTLFSLCSPKLQGRLLVCAAKNALLALSPAERARRREAGLGPLRSGQTVVIVGGGPAGASCGIALKRLAAKTGIELRVVIHEPKEFRGRPQYNQCVGVLSPPIVEVLEDMVGVPFPWHLVHKRITGYVLHGDRESVVLDGDEVSYALRRIDFDDYLLKQAEQAGVEVIKSRVTDIELTPEGVVVYSESANLRADVVVGAFGLDEGTTRIFERSTRYRAPRCLTSIVTKMHPSERFLEQFGRRIHAFLPPLRGVEFGAATPKANHITINIAGAHVTAAWMERFLALPELKKILPERSARREKELSYFKGRIPVSIARGFYGNRYVVVGDAAGLVRPFKGKGVTSACLTATIAAETMVNEGISRRAFASFSRRCDDFMRDAPYGRFVRLAAIATANSGYLDAIIRLCRNDLGLRQILYDSVSGRTFYRQICRRLFEPRRAFDIATCLLAAGLRLR